MVKMLSKLPGATLRALTPPSTLSPVVCAASGLDVEEGAAAPAETGPCIGGAGGGIDCAWAPCAERPIVPASIAIRRSGAVLAASLPLGVFLGFGLINPLAVMFRPCIEILIIRPKLFS